MERLSRFALYLGMGMAITVFVLFLITALPGILNHSLEQWESIERSGRAQDQIYSTMTEHPAYQAMYEVYPDAKEEFVHREVWGTTLRVGAMDFETQNQLILDLHYSAHDDRTEAFVHCNPSGGGGNNVSVDGLFAEDFIRNTDCLEVAGAAGGGKQATAVPAAAAE